ncbi:MAG: BREX system P-loop protein BrxC, partial [Methanofollis sp.]|nr:BREX system P-loop protein BrxC [Methanofollis sp.]
MAHVNDDTSKQAMDVLRYELETFVCDGQYKLGLERILESYLKNLEKPQPAVWVSGFYGSGKSHLVKMLRALWVDTVFEDGATARSIAHLPIEVKDRLKELSTQAKRYGGLHAASGTLGSSAEGSVRLALLNIVFKSAGLPEQYHLARFVMWLKENGIYDQVRSCVEQKGNSWDQELEDFFVSEVLYDALCQVKPKVFPSERSPIEVLPKIYPIVEDVSNDEMVRAIRQALSYDGKFPLTLIVLDEVQQYIGGDNKRSELVQETVETCSKKIGGKLLFIGTGQTAVTGTSYLNKLSGRFTVRIELSDSDVEEVIKKVVLAKNPQAISPIEEVMDANLGEISRHLAGTSIRHRQDDRDNFAQMYPILPVRNRFWERTLHILDLTGTESQLRNQLSMVHKAIQTNLDDPLGVVVPADFLYFDMADKLLQFHILPRKVHEKTMSWYKGSDDEKLMARACGLVFLINKLADNNNEIGIRATVDTLADLMVEDLSAGSSGLRNRLPGLLEKCDLLMKVEDEYRIQTEESTAWNDEFSSQYNVLSHDDAKIEVERESRIRKMFGEKVKIRSLSHGVSNVSREISLVFDTSLPDDSEEKICVWVRDGWSVDENFVRADARQAGNQSPTIYVHIPKRSVDDLRHQ